MTKNIIIDMKDDQFNPTKIIDRVIKIIRDHTTCIVGMNDGFSNSIITRPMSYVMDYEQFKLYFQTSDFSQKFAGLKYHSSMHNKLSITIPNTIYPQENISYLNLTCGIINKGGTILESNKYIMTNIFATRLPNTYDKYSHLNSEQLFELTPVYCEYFIYTKEHHEPIIIRININLNDFVFHINYLDGYECEPIYDCFVEYKC